MSTPPKEPVAIVGIGCRFPGAHGPRAFWELLRDGVDAIGEIPASRFETDRYYDAEPATPGRITTRWGGFLEDADKFDADFFGISPREADRLDPQQRWLMETACEALEDAGAVPPQMSGSQTGVFIGMWTNEYEARLFRDPRTIDFYMTVGSGRYSASGRLSYLFGLQGPSLTLDTGCSASLVAVHLACQSLWTGESTLALAGGVNAILEPSVSIAYSQSRMVAPDGRCKFGDARADGYVRSEGAGLVVLKPLSRALHDGDRIYALIRGSAVNNDGRSSGFLTTPGGAGQEEALRLAYRHAGVSPGAVDYVEAHGTGTRAGDPVEIQALGAVLGEGRAADAPCRIGSVKTNIGHTESAAGVAGLIKVALALHNCGFPASLQVRELNPAIPWDTLPLTLQRTFEEWPVRSGPRFAGVSSLGIAGTNAHVVLQSADVATAGAAHDEQPAVVRPHLLAISAQSEPALAARLQQFKDLLSSDSAERPALTDLCWTAAVRRTHRPYRAAFTAWSEAGLRDLIDAALNDEARPGIARGGRLGERLGRVVFVFPGQGSQWLGMGRQLLDHEPVFRDAIEVCDRAIAVETGWSVLDQLRADESRSRLREIDVIQPVLFSVEVALAALWRSWGFEPAAVVGHSMGEVAAALVAGVLSTEQAAQIICRRSRLLLGASGKGAMAVVELTIEDAARAVRGREHLLAVAVSNSTRSTVLSGDPGALDALLQDLESRDVFCRRIKVDVASHSPQMDPLRPDLLAALSGLAPTCGTVPMCSTVTGEFTDGAAFDAHYWVRNLRAPVLFSTAVKRLLESGHDTFIEMSPHPILVPAMQEGIAEAGALGAIAVGSTHRDQDEQLALVSNVSAIYAAGHDVAFDRVVSAGSLATLPLYPWQRERFWFDAPTQLDLVTGGRPARHGGERHAYLGAPAKLADGRGTLVWHFDIDAQVLRNLTPDGDVTRTVPVATYIDLMFAAARAVGGTDVTATDVVFGRPQTVQLQTSTTMQMVTEIIAPDTYAWRVYSNDGEDWIERARAQLHLGRERAAFAPALIDDRTTAATIELPEHLQHELSLYRAHPALVQAAFDHAGLSRRAGLPAAIRRLTWRGDLPRVITSRFTHGAGEYAVVIGDDAGRDLLGVEGLQAQDGDAATGAPGNVADWLFESQWLEDAVAPAPSAAMRRWLLVGRSDALASALATELLERGHHVDAIAVLTADVLRQRATESTEPLLVVHVVGSAERDVPDAARSAALAALDTVRAMADCESLAIPPRVWFLTRQAHSVVAGDVVDCTQTPVWGLARAVAEEHPLVWAGVVDVAIGAERETAAALAGALLADDAEDQIAIRDGRRSGLRLVRTTPATHQLAVRPTATYLIAGGLGNLGLQVARWLVGRGARRVALVGRRGLPSRDQWSTVLAGHQAECIAAIREMETVGAEVFVGTADIAVAADLERVLSEIGRRGWPPIAGVFQCAGVAHGQLVAHLDEETFDTVWRSKVPGTWNLLEGTAHLPLDCFVMFSSIAALLPFPGQASYAASNAFVDAAAATYRARGRRVLAIDWGQWADIGMAAELGRRGALGGRRGFKGLGADQALNALGRVAGDSQRSQLAVMSFNWREWRSNATATPLFAALAATEQDAPADLAASDLSAQLSTAVDQEQRRRVLEGFLQAQLATVLKRPASRIELTAPVRSMGLDSLMALELRNRIEGGTGLRLPATLAWNYPTVITMARFLDSKLAPTIPPAAPATVEVVAADEAMEQLLAEIEQLSDDQARRLAVEGQ
jgi:myxalamid-type polyketide synthase MxaE and MxaD